MTDFNTALTLASRGFKIFPVKAGAKAPPLWSDWPAKAAAALPTDDWPPQANVGIHCAGLAVIDVDVKKGGSDSALALELEGNLPDTLESITPSGGRHLFYRLPEGHPGVPNTVGKLGKGLDVRSTGGYVLGAGSRIPAGSYEWRNPDTPIAPVPKWLLARLGRIVPKIVTSIVASNATIPDADEGTVARATAWLAGRPGAVEGQGGDAFTFATAAFLRDLGLSQQQTFELMAGDWNARCSPPWLLNELGAKVRNAYNYGQSEPGAKAVTAADFPSIVQDSPLSISGGQASKVNRNRPIPLSEIAPQPSSAAGYIVKGLLLNRTYAMFYGAPGEGKTFAAMDIAYNVAAGSQWMDRRVRQGSVLYVGFEAYGGLANRARALRQKYGENVPLYFTPGGFNLRLLEGRRALGEIIAAMPEKPKLIVFDTFAYALAGGDENSAQDVGAFNEAAQALIQSTGACVLLVHHTGKDTSKGARGSSALPAAMDTEIAIADGAITPTKQREIELGEAIGFKLTQVMIGVDDDGDSITSCVVDSAAITSDRPRPRRGPEQLVWEKLLTLRPDNKPIGWEELLAACLLFLPSGNRGRVRFATLIGDLRSRGLLDYGDDMAITRKTV